MTLISELLADGKRSLKVLKTLTNLKRRITAAVLLDKPTKKSASKLSQCPFHLSITSLAQDSCSIDTTMTWLDDTQQQEVCDNRLNERLEAFRY